MIFLQVLKALSFSFAENHCLTVLCEAMLETVSNVPNTLIWICSNFLSKENGVFWVREQQAPKH